MDWMVFITNLSGQLAWPITTITLVVLLKKNIEQIFPRIESFKHNKTEINFAKIVNEVVDKAKNVEDEGNPLPVDLQAEESRLLSKIYLAPHAIMHQAYAVLDRELLELFDLHLPEEKRTRINVRSGNQLLSSLGFDDELLGNITKLRRIRQNVMTSNEQQKGQLTEEQVKSYIELALDCAAKARTFISGGVAS
ncbi:hypothetical protein MJ923_03640 [Shewanella sp. 3B26]|uniref:DUF4145 domain-containing protein n=1 Tax=Shewanella zhuhaiensis TaxID=2919576 RepID=A0AAJ1BEM2_9GAMM|nr:hypothetical protein [Shewanella zhuhaiensis]MCH4293396.1 hypothetical protein [Shewanella zhuhaiensis]